MSKASPCIGVCRFDPATGWCLGCARSRAECRAWKRARPEWREAASRWFRARLRALRAGGRPVGEAARRWRPRRAKG